MTLHLELAPRIAPLFTGDLAAPVEQKQDALVLRLKNETTLTVRYAAPDAYSLRWLCRAGAFGIDTAPLHRGLATFPNHLHLPDGRVIADPVTSPSAAPLANLEKLLHALLADPTLQEPAAR